jgi:enediyne biosynthesis protein E4
MIREAGDTGDGPGNVRSSAVQLATVGLFLSAGILAGCSRAPDAPSVTKSSSSGTPSKVRLLTPTPTQFPGSPIRFEWLKECGVDFTYYGNPSPEHYMTEQNGGGVAILDFDGDGRQDLFLTNGDHFDRPATAVGAVHELYRNRETAEGSLLFVPAGQAAGVSLSGFGMGAVAGDFDNDGFPDLFICHYGAVQLLHNNGDGTFADLTQDAGISGEEWATSAVFADLDSDGDLDLYVANYVEYASTDPPCFLETAARIPISCGPIGRAAEADRLWENAGDGTFRDSSTAAGIRAVPPGKGLAVEAVDLDGDNRLDLYVANDTTDNFLFMNRGQMRFDEVGLLRGAAVGPKGTPESSMGIACADFDHNGRFDLFVTNFENAVNDLYLNLSDAGFLHASAGYGLDLPSRPMLAFGTIAADFDLDDWDDLFVANGHIWDLSAGQDKHQYEMTPQLFRNRAGRRFEDVSTSAGPYFAERWLGRSAAVADFDDDGLADLIVSHQRRSAAVLRNASSAAGHSLTIRAVGRTAAREPRGVRICSVIDGETRQFHVRAGGSYQAGSDSRVIIPTGTTAASVVAIVTWSPDDVETWEHLPSTGQIVLIEGASPRWTSIP